MTDWNEHEDAIDDVISDSIDMDWTSRTGARASVAWLNENAAASALSSLAGGSGLAEFMPETTGVQSRYVIVHQLRASADIQDGATKRETGWATTSDRAELMRRAADAIERLAALSPEAPAREVTAFAMNGPMTTHPTLRSANIARQVEWDQDGQITASYRGNELAGEVGEACNVIKKLERERLGILGSRATVGELADELADVLICADLIAMHYGIDLEAAVARKFNATSEKVGLQTRLAPPNDGGDA